MTILAQVSVDANQLGLPPAQAGPNIIANVLRIVFGVAGGVALLIVTIAGFKYVLSQGNPQETAKAKNTILYALIGLVVCIAALGIVTFVIGEVDR
jgi:hypothetical protein